MPPSLPRICPPVSFWNFSSAVAPAPNAATARHASAVTRNRLFVEFFLALIEAIPGRSSGLERLLQHSLQGRTRGLVSQLHVSSGQPHLVTTAARFFSGVETKLVLLDAPLAGALVTHRGDRKRAVSLEDLAPMRFIRQLHPREFRLNLRTRELLEFLLSRGRWLECKRAEQRGRRCCELFFRRLACRAYRATHEDQRNARRSPPVVCRLFRGRMPGRTVAARASNRSGDAQLFALAVLSSAARSPLASFTASSLAQKCMKNSRGCSLSMWLWTAVTSMPFERSALITGLTSSAVSTKSPVIAALPPPVGWKPIAVATPVGPGGASCVPLSLTGSRRGTPN